MTDIKVSNTELDKDITEVSVGDVETTTVQAPITVEGYKKEFTIVGDAFFASIETDDVPEWLSSLLNRVVNTYIEDSLQGLQHLDAALQAAINQIEIAQNTYDEQINIQQTVENSIVSYLSTLNASIEDNSANIIDVRNTYASKDYASSLIANHIESSVNGGTIQARLDEIRNTITTLRQSLSQSIDTLESNLTDTENEVTATADAVEKLYTYTGVDSRGEPTGTGLLADLQILQKQQDGILETYTGTHDVITYQDVNPVDGVPDPDSVTLVTTAEPYCNWTPLEGSGAPVSTNEEIHRVYKDVDNNKFYMFKSKFDGWVEIEETVYQQNLHTLRTIHIGDTYIKYELTGGERKYLGAYKFIRTAEDTTIPYGTDSEGFTWAKITDTDAQNAFMIALQAKDLADGKRKVFTTQPFGEQDTGDLWIDVNNDNTRVIRVFIGQPRSQGFLASEWVIADEQLKQFVDTTYTPEVTSLKNQVDGKVEYIFVRTTTSNTYSLKDGIARTLIEPYNNERDNLIDITYLQNVPSKSVLLDRIAEVVGVTSSNSEAFNGSVVYFADEKPGEAYWYSSSLSSKWVAISDTSIYEALVAAENAQSSADGVVVSFYGYESKINPDNFTNLEKFPALRYWYDTTTTTLKVKKGNNWVEHTEAKLDDTLTAVKVDRVTTDNSGEPITNPYYEKMDTKIYTYNGNNWVSATPEGIISESRKLLELDAFLKGPDGKYGSVGSKFDIYTEAKADDAYQRASSNFTYNSDIELPVIDPNTGQTVMRQIRSGFGINASMDNRGAVTNEFWVNAETFRFISTGAPKTIDDVLTEGTVSSLSATVRINRGGIVLNRGGAIRSENANFSTKNGVFLGRHHSKYRFLAGNGHDYIYYNGSSLRVRTKDIKIRNNSGSFELNSNATGVNPNIKGAVIEASVLKEVPKIGIPNSRNTRLNTEDLIRAKSVKLVYPGGSAQGEVVLSSYYVEQIIGESLVTVQGAVQFNGNCSYQVLILRRTINRNHYGLLMRGMVIRHNNRNAKIYPLTTSVILVPHDYRGTPTSSVPLVRVPATSGFVVDIMLVRTSGQGRTLNSVRTTTTKTILSGS